MQSLLGSLRLACGYVADQAERNIGLDELAGVAGIGKFRLIRLFHEHTGLPPHARKSPTASARLADYSKPVNPSPTSPPPPVSPTRVTSIVIFQRSLGLTPGEYRRRLPSARDGHVGHFS
jgi:hypothetical protein